MKIVRICCLLFMYTQILAEFYLEPYTGILFGAEKDSIAIQNTYNIDGLLGCFSRCKLKAMEVRPLCGLKCGGWFSQKNSFGLWLDCQYHHLNYEEWACTHVAYVDYTSNELCNSAVACTQTCLKNCGYAVTLALPLAYRWRHHVQKSAPYGRWQLYFALGPGLFLTKQCINLTICPHVANDTNFTVVVANAKTINFQQKLKAAACLLMDGGFSYVVSKHFAIDFFMQYRFTKYRACCNRCAYLYARQTCHLGSANLGLVINF